MPQEESLSPEAELAEPGTEQTAEPAAQQPQTPAPPPDVVSREEYNRALEQNRTLMGQVEQLLGVVQSGQARAVPAPMPEPELSDQQLAEMIDTGGDSAAVIRAMGLKQAQTERRLATLVKGLEERGTTLLRGLASRSAKSDMPYYEQFRDQIDRVVQSMPGDALANPEAYILAHNTVVGNPTNVERLVQQRVEEELRKRAAPASTQEQPGAPTRTGPVRDPNAIPTPQEIFPDMTPAEVEGQLRALGYKDWPSYWNQVKEYEHAQ